MNGDGPKKPKSRGAGRTWPAPEGTISAQPQSRFMRGLEEFAPGLFDVASVVGRKFREQERIYETNPLSFITGKPSELLTPEGFFAAIVGPFGKPGSAIKGFLSDLPENYGRRLVIVDPPKGLKSFRASWGDKSGAWNLDRAWGPQKRGKQLDLDANEVIVYARNMREAEEALSHAPALPLASGSFEARARRGEFGPEERRRLGPKVEEGGKSVFASGKLSSKRREVTVAPPETPLPPEPAPPARNIFGVIQGGKAGKPASREQEILDRLLERGEPSSRPSIPGTTTYVDPSGGPVMVDMTQLPGLPSLTGGPIFLPSGEINMVEQEAWNRFYKAFNERVATGKSLAPLLNDPRYEKLVPRAIPNLMAGLYVTKFDIPNRALRESLITKAARELKGIMMSVPWPKAPILEEYGAKYGPAIENELRRRGVAVDFLDDEKLRPLIEPMFTRKLDLNARGPTYEPTIVHAYLNDAAEVAGAPAQDWNETIQEYAARLRDTYASDVAMRRTTVAPDIREAMLEGLDVILQMGKKPL